MRSRSFRTTFEPAHSGQSIRGEVETIAHLMNYQQPMAFRKPAGIMSEPRSARSFGRTVRGLLAPSLVLVVLCYAFPARAAETTPIKCGVNEDRVWVYDSLNSFDVSLKLKCGEPVEIIGRENGYVKIRTSSGKEGYVPEKALPKPPAPEENNQNSGEAQGSRQEWPQSVAAARARNSAGSAPSAGAKPVEHASTSVNQTKLIAGQPASARDSNDTASSTARATGTPEETNSSIVAATDTSNQEKAKSQPLPANSQAKPVTYSPAHSTTRPTDLANADSKTASASQGKTKSASSSAAATNTKAATAKASSSKTVSVSNVSVAAPTSAPAAPSKIELADNLPSAPPASSGSMHVATSPRDPDEEEEPVMKPLENNEACRIYFSAYGLSPNQYKWMTRNRGKSFPGICPAPAPTMVDFIVIFTHDADFYNGTMPTPVHTDKNGFSDFTPLTTVDTAVVSPSEADKNRREYVWVFHTKRGTFDPAKFSPKRRPLFSTTESNKLGTAAGGRSAEDALRFMEQYGVDR
jgi:uncharacterized protein YgiM (DUF1202 family)